MKLSNSELKYSRDCRCCGSNPDCAECSGRNVVPIGNISFEEMQVGVMYMVKVTKGEIGECMLKKWDQRHVTFTLFFLDVNGELSEHSVLQTIVFRLDLLAEMKKMQSRYLEIDDFVEHLRNYRLIDRYDLDTLANTVAPGIYNAVFGNCLGDHDRKHGTSLRSFVTAQPAPGVQGDKHYNALLRFITNEIRSSQVTLTWALRQFEKECGISVVDVLYDAEKSFEQFTTDAILSARS